MMILSLPPPLPFPRDLTSLSRPFRPSCSPSQRTLIVLSLLLVALSKGLLTVVTFGIGVPAGIFIPSMVVGASVGRVLGLWVQTWREWYPDAAYFASCPPSGPCVTPGTYAMVGAAATLAGVTRMTVSLVVIMFELTGALTYVVPVMIAVMIAKWVGDALEPEGIYDGLIKLRNYPFLEGREMYKGSAVLSEIMTPADKVRCITVQGMCVDDLGEFVVVGEGKVNCPYHLHWLLVPSAVPSPYLVGPIT